MDEPRRIPVRVPFSELGWADDAPGIRAREEWCEEGHRGYVLRGATEYEFDDGRERLRALEGEAFLLPPAALGDGAHRGRNLAPGPTRLFLIDDEG